jgi:hypothetical protein
MRPATRSEHSSPPCLNASIKQSAQERDVSHFPVRRHSLSVRKQKRTITIKNIKVNPWHYQRIFGIMRRYQRLGHPEQKTIAVAQIILRVTGPQMATACTNEPKYHPTPTHRLDIMTPLPFRGAESSLKPIDSKMAVTQAHIDIVHQLIDFVHSNHSYMPVV